MLRTRTVQIAIALLGGLAVFGASGGRCVAAG